MSNQTSENEADNRYETKKKDLKTEICLLWLGKRDSNPRMLGPEPSALPLGDSPWLGDEQR